MRFGALLQRDRRAEAPAAHRDPAPHHDDARARGADRPGDGRGRARRPRSTSAGLVTCSVTGGRAAGAAGEPPHPAAATAATASSGRRRSARTGPSEASPDAARGRPGRPGPASILRAGDRARRLRRARDGDRDGRGLDGEDDLAVRAPARPGPGPRRPGAPPRIARVSSFSSVRRTWRCSGRAPSSASKPSRGQPGDERVVDLELDRRARSAGASATRRDHQPRDPLDLRRRSAARKVTISSIRLRNSGRNASFAAVEHALVVRRRPRRR